MFKGGVAGIAGEARGGRCARDAPALDNLGLVATLKDPVPIGPWLPVPIFFEGQEHDALSSLPSHPRQRTIPWQDALQCEILGHSDARHKSKNDTPVRHTNTYFQYFLVKHGEITSLTWKRSQVQVLYRPPNWYKRRSAL